MSRVFIAILGLAVAVLLARLFAPAAFTRSSAYDEYVCAGCGLKKAEHVSKYGRIVYRRRVTFEDTAISRAFKVKNCQHSWLPYRYAHNPKRSPLRGGASVGSGLPYNVLRFLLIDERFAQELSQMENPVESWAALVSSLNSSREFDKAFVLWWVYSDRVGFASWAATNGLSGKVKAR